MNTTDARTDIDAVWHSAIGKLTAGISPAALTTAHLDWAMHVAGSPAKQTELWVEAQNSLLDLLQMKSNEDVSDKRFADPAWNQFPYSLYRDTFLAQQAWWNTATRNVPGVDSKHLDIVNFVTRQMLDMASPTNFTLTNPTVRERTVQELGQNLMRGLQNWVEDFNQLLLKTPAKTEEFTVGETVARTPGDIVLRNDLIELIRYTPTKKKLHPEPILIVPAWIMKYYILDLSDHNSLVRYLCDQGFEVYMISWKNPTAEDAEKSMQDYVDLGVTASVEHVLSGGAKDLHAVGYCLGGTLLSIAAAAMARDQRNGLKSMSLLASQVDFAEPGEIGLFINESQVTFLEDLMKTQGYLRADQMAGAFRMLRSNDLIWSRVIRHYLLGERTEMNDLMAWNADSTRMPAKMHSEYLRHLFLENQLAKGRYKVDGRPVALTDIRVPIFCVATEKDHVSPWRSVYRLLLLTDTDVTFLLTNGGHNGGILSEPGHENRHHRLRHKVEGDPHRAPNQWFDTAEVKDGSWWPVWVKWFKSQSGPVASARPEVFTALGPAPGTYVFG